MVRTNANTKICSPKHWKCYLETMTLMEKGMNASFGCECLPSCAEISFTTTSADVQLTTGSGGFIVSDPNLRQLNLDDRYTDEFDELKFDNYNIYFRTGQNYLWYTYFMLVHW